MHVVAYFVNKCVVQDLHLRSWWYGGDIHKLRTVTSIYRLHTLRYIAEFAYKETFSPKQMYILE